MQIKNFEPMFLWGISGELTASEKYKDFEVLETFCPGRKDRNNTKQKESKLNNKKLEIIPKCIVLFQNTRNVYK